MKDAAQLVSESRKLRAQSDEILRRANQLTYKSKSLLHLSRKFQDAKFTAPIIHTCSCGKKFGPVEWSKLPFIEYQTVEHLDAEHRNCPCGSTLTLIIERRKCHAA